MTDTKLIQFNCPEKLLEAFDKMTEGLYGNRTEALLDAMRDLIRKLEEQALRMPEASSK